MLNLKGLQACSLPLQGLKGYSRAVPAPSHWLDLCCLLACPSVHEEIALVALGHGLVVSTVVGLSDLRGIV